MPKTITVATPLEKNILISYLLTGRFPDNITHLNRRVMIRKFSNFILINNIVYYNSGNIKRELVYQFDENRVNNIIKSAHEPGHIGINSLRNQINERYYGIKKSVIKSFIRNCENCNRSTRIQVHVPLTPIVPYYIRERLMVDLVDFSMYENENDGYRYIFNFVETFSKFLFSFKTKRKTAEVFGGILKNQLYSEGKFDNLHSDNGREFVNRRVLEICDHWGINIIHGRPRHPQSQGQVERLNRTIKERLRKACVIGSNRWIDNHRRIVYQYNNTIHTATKQKPFFIYRGTSNNIIRNSVDNIINYNDLRNNYINYAAKYTSEYNNRVRSEEIVIGDRVLLSKDFDTNIQTRRNPLDSFYYDEIYTLESKNIYCANIKGPNGEIRSVHITRIKKLNRDV